MSARRRGRSRTRKRLPRAPSCSESDAGSKSSADVFELSDCSTTTEHDAAHEPPKEQGNVSPWSRHVEVHGTLERTEAVLWLTPRVFASLEVAAGSYAMLSRQCTTQNLQKHCHDNVHVQANAGQRIPVLLLPLLDHDRLHILDLPRTKCAREHPANLAAHHESTQAHGADDNADNDRDTASCADLDFEAQDGALNELGHHAIPVGLAVVSTVVAQALDLSCKCLHRPTVATPMHGQPPHSSTSHHERACRGCCMVTLEPPVDLDSIPHAGELLLTQCSPEADVKWTSRLLGLCRMLLRGRVLAVGCLLKADWFGHSQGSCFRVLAHTPLHALPSAQQSEHASKSRRHQSPHMLLVGPHTRLKMQPALHRGVPAPSTSPLAARATTTAPAGLGSESVEASRSASAARSCPKLPSIDEWCAAVCADLLGYDTVVRRMVTAIHTGCRQERNIRNLGVCPCAPLLVYGPTGAGKTALARSLARHSGMASFCTTCAELFQSREGESEQLLLNLFDAACSSSPAIILLDDLESLSPRGSEVGARLVHLLSTLLERLQGHSPRGSALCKRPLVFIIATCIDPGEVDPLLMSAGRFDASRRIHLPTLSEEGRLSLLRHLCGRVPVVGMAGTALATGDDVLRRVASQCVGVVGADLVKLTRECMLRAIRRQHAGTQVGPQASQKSGLPVHVSYPDFEWQMRRAAPASMQSYAFSQQHSRFRLQDLGGLEDQKQRLHNAVVGPLKDKTKREALERMLGFIPPAGALLHGPSGTGKTSLALAMAHASGANVLCVQGSELVSSVVGASERAVRDLFQRARACAPAIIVLDQVEAVAPRRSAGSSGAQTWDRVLSCLLTEMDGLITESAGNSVQVIATCSLPHLLDPAILRPGRLGLHIGLPPPDVHARVAIFALVLATMPLRPQPLEPLREWSRQADPVRWAAWSPSPALVSSLLALPPSPSHSPVSTTSAASSKPSPQSLLSSPSQSSSQPSSSSSPSKSSSASASVTLAAPPVSPLLLCIGLLAVVTEHFSGADIRALCREAGMCALRESSGASVVTPYHLTKALSSTSASLCDVEMHTW